MWSLNLNKCLQFVYLKLNHASTVHNTDYLSKIVQLFVYYFSWTYTWSHNSCCSLWDWQGREHAEPSDANQGTLLNHKHNIQVTTYSRSLFHLLSRYCSHRCCQVRVGLPQPGWRWGWATGTAGESNSSTRLPHLLWHWWYEASFSSELSVDVRSNVLLKEYSCLCQISPARRRWIWRSLVSRRGGACWSTLLSPANLKLGIIRWALILIHLRWFTSTWLCSELVLFCYSLLTLLVPLLIHVSGNGDFLALHWWTTELKLGCAAQFKWFRFVPLPYNMSFVWHLPAAMPLLIANCIFWYQIIWVLCQMEHPMSQQIVSWKHTLMEQLCTSRLSKCLFLSGSVKTNFC
jgi:hypothetical protein